MKYFDTFENVCKTLPSTSVIAAAISACITRALAEIRGIL